MPRRKISEFRAKTMLNKALNTTYVGWSVEDSNTVAVIDEYDKYVLKVDQAVKGRFKKGLVLLEITKNDLPTAIDRFCTQGFNSFLIEPYFEHTYSKERYLAITQDKTGIHIALSDKGGVDIEDNHQSIEKYTLTKSANWNVISDHAALSLEVLKKLVTIFKENYLTLLEINPYIVNEDGQVTLLDAAIEVDDAGLYFAQDWTEADIRNPRSIANYKQEDIVSALNRESSASFNLSVLNPNGSIFLLLSGGGASVVIADEIYNFGLGSELANYGEYSGNPSEHETYLYTKQILSLVTNSTAKNKVIFIGGAAANFTDIANTFEGIIKAIDEHANTMRKEGVKIFVRRGGPRQKIGLARIEDVLKKNDLFGEVWDTTISLSEAVRTALGKVK